VEIPRLVTRNASLAKSWLFPPWIQQSMLTTELDRLRAELAARTPGNPATRGYKVYSQTDEDGILDAILRTLGAGSQVFAEFGCGNGLENNTHALLLRGWKGVWIDGSARNIGQIAAAFPLTTPRLSVVQEFITRENAWPVVRDGLARLEGAPRDLDLLSMDLDGNDAIIVDQVLAESSPRVIVVEYNGKYHWPLDVEMPYDAANGWGGDDYYGASLGAYVRHLGDRYRLVACGLAGINAFFVRSDLASAFPSYPPEELYQPSRQHLIHITSGHPSTLRNLAHALTAGGAR
jgi:hypothetical protein